MADLLSALSVLLVFLTFLFNAIEKEVSEKINERKPEVAQIQKLKQFNKSLIKLLLLKAIPIAVAYLIIFFTFFPRTTSIINTSHLSLWGFNELNTIFVYVEIGLLGLMTYAVIKVIQLIKKIRE